MCPIASYEEGTEIILDREVLAPGPGFTDHANGGSDIWRHGDRVTLALRVTNAAHAAWAEKSKYALGTVVTEGGKTYVLILAEPEAEKAKPTADAGVHWQEVVNPQTICTLPPAYRPPSAVLNGAGTLEVKANGEVAVIGSLVAEAAKVLDITFRAAGVSP